MTDEAPPDKQTLAIRSAERTLLVLEVISRNRRRTSLAGIARDTGLDKSAVQRCAATLVSAGYLRQTADHKLELTPKCLELGYNFLISNALMERAYRVLMRLRREVGERINLSLFAGSYLVYAMRLTGKGEWELPMSLVGRRMPTYCTAGGRAMLSKLSDDEVLRVLETSTLHRRTPVTLTSPALILDAVRTARADGYAVVAGEAVAREIAIAAAVTDSHGKPIAAVHVSSELSRWDKAAFADHFAEPIVSAAGRLSFDAVPVDHARS
ncbi:IclR family transcriptional regulator [Rhodoplanes serenus]|uniref:IclR family transcriptional regulator n=1 Tax=Rhodoplanes serenus TaxID=200615 RepID=UPI00131AE073|nr:IclR family transcriptional regulator [Rhodoplanes serenus]